MAIVTGGIERLLFNYPGLDLGKAKFVGWGAGQYFRAFYPFLTDKLKLEYTVCPTTGAQGGDVLGVPVRPPSVLLGEDKENTVVVIFAARFFDVMHVLRDDFPGLKFIRAFEEDDFQGTRQSFLSEIESFSKVFSSLSLDRSISDNPEFGIFVQGAVSAITPFVLAWNRVKFPGAYQCMVTWEGQDKKILALCEPWVDKLILASPPDNPGYLYLNSVLRSCRLGAQHLFEKGIEFSVRTRTDCVLFGSVFHVLNKYFSFSRGHGRIAAQVSQGWWHHMPFMVNDKVMVGRTEDLLRFWSMTEDPRSADHPAFHIAEESNFLNLQDTIPEVMVWKNYAKSLGRPVDSLRDSYEFIQDYVLPVEPMLTTFSMKFISLFSVCADRRFDSSLDSWKQLVFNPEKSLSYAASVESLNMTVKDFWEQKVG